MSKLALPIITAIVLMAGCSGKAPEQADVSAEIAEYEKRIADLEKTISGLQADLKVVKSKTPAEATKKTVTISHADLKADKHLLEWVRTIVQGELDQRIGSPEQIQKIFEEALKDEMTAYAKNKEDEAARKREEAEQKRKEWREKREKERKEREARAEAAFAERLSLSDDQSVKVKELHDGLRKNIWETMGEMRKDGSFSPGEFQKAMELINEDHQKSMKEVLNEDQYKTYKSEYADPIARFMGGMGGWGRGRGGR